MVFFLIEKLALGKTTTLLVVFIGIIFCYAGFLLSPPKVAFRNTQTSPLSVDITAREGYYDIILAFRSVNSAGLQKLIVDPMGETQVAGLPALDTV